MFACEVHRYLLLFYFILINGLFYIPMCPCNGFSRLKKAAYKSIYTDNKNEVKKGNNGEGLRKAEFKLLFCIR